jgi:hypothetical protein
MGPERKRMPTVAAMMIGMVLSDPEALTFGYAMAVSKGDEDSLEIAKFFRKQAENLGVTEKEFNDAVDMMKTTDEFLKNLDETS